MRLRFPLTCIIVTVLAGLAVGGDRQTALAKQNKLNESGSFDCSCSGGSGTCTFESSTENTNCFKGADATCSGTCKLTITPDTPKAAIKGSARTKLNTMKKSN